MNFSQFISNINSWSEFKKALAPLSKLEKGNSFEELTKYFLLTKSVYQSELKQVWLQKELPTFVRKKLNLPTNDQGIDLIAEHKDGSYWAIQCKYLQDEDTRLSHRAISTFTSLSKLTAKNISFCLVATTADDYAKLYKGNNAISFINADEWNKLTKENFDSIRGLLKGKPAKPKPYKPKPHQQKALKEAKAYFLTQKKQRGKLVFPCGAGKSLTGYWIKQELNAHSTIVAVPSLSLVKQTLEVYLRESVANKQQIEWLCVCSDEGIGKNDDVVIHTNEIGVPCITDKKYIADWLKTNKNKKTVIFTTYQSGKTIAEAAKIAKAKFDLGIMDEAHKTVGDQDKLFSHLLFDKNIKIDKRIFMTATERRYAGSSEHILSMDDEAVYGETFTQMPFKEAIHQEILSDYKIITLFISDKEVKEMIEKNAFVKPQGKEWDKETEARTLASMIALRKAMKQFPIHHAVTFHSSIKKAEAFGQSQELFSKAFPQFKKVDSFHVSGSMPTSQRSKIVNEFAACKKAIITNAKCLTEGVDVPNIDCVLFADPRKSTVDIVQAVGRALRKKEGKQFGYVILPVFTKSRTKEEIIESAEFKEILTTLRALASNDERIIEYFRDVNKSDKKSKTTGGLVQFEIDENIIERISEKDLMQSLQLKTWDKLAKLSWMPFEEAREFVRGLRLNNQKDWFLFARSIKKPIDIPYDPGNIYKDNWISYGDWLGTGRIANQFIKYLEFSKAKEFVHKLKFKNIEEWRSYCQTNNFPKFLPKNPNQTYKNNGWISFGDWLGNFRIATQHREYLPYDEAKRYIQKLRIKSNKEWRAFLKSGNKPDDIPTTPERVYANSGWVSWGEWFGTGRISGNKRVYKDYHSALKYVQSLNLKKSSDWNKFVKSKNKPIDIPVSPQNVYKNSGWVSWGEWLGTGRVSDHKKEFVSFAKARKFCHILNLKNHKEWRSYSKSEKKPNYIPSAPNEIYKFSGWNGWNDFLGTEIGHRNPRKIFLDFNSAKKIIKKIKLNSVKEWQSFAKTKLRPANIPSNPERVYKKEWKGWADFLGKEEK